MSSTALHSQRLPRAAKDRTLQKLAAHNTISLHLVTPVLVQVAPTGPSGELTVHYTLDSPLRILHVKNMGKDFTLEELRTCPLPRGRCSVGHRRIREFFEIQLTIASKTLEKIARCARQGQPHRIVLLHHLTMLQLLPGHAHVSMFCRWHCDRCDRCDRCD